MEDFKSLETSQLYDMLVKYTESYVGVEKEIGSETKIEYGKKIDELLAEIKKRKENDFK